MDILEIDFKQKLSKKYCCKICDYNTNRKSNLLNHFGSAKHQKEMIGNSFKQKLSNNKFICNICKNEYKTLSGLWKHKNKCKKSKEDEEIEKLVSAHNEPSDKEMMMMLIKDNAEMRKMMMEVWNS